MALYFSRSITRLRKTWSYVHAFHKVFVLSLVILVVFIALFAISHFIVCHNLCRPSMGQGIVLNDVCLYVLLYVWAITFERLDRRS